MDKQHSLWTSMNLLLVVLVVVVPASTARPKCKGNPRAVGACYSIHGRVSLGADTVRLWLWPIATKRLLGVTAGPSLDDADDPIFPQDLQFKPGDKAIYGEFEVCPFTPERKGTMRLVCVESDSNLVVKR